MKRLYFLLSLVMLALTAGAGTVTDVVIPEIFSSTVSYSYSTHVGSTESGSVYTVNAGLYKMGTMYFVINSSLSPSGIVLTESKGRCMTIAVGWNSMSSKGRTLDVYGSHTPFTLEDMWAGNNCEKIGTIVKEAAGAITTTVDFGAEYEYVGLRSAASPIYINSFTFEYDDAPVGMSDPKVSLNCGAGGSLKASLPDEDNANVNSGDIIEAGKDILFTVKSNNAYVIESLTVNGLSVDPAIHLTSYTLTMTATAGLPLNVEATFAPLKVASATVTFSAGEGGTIEAANASDFTPVKVGQKVTTPNIVSFVATPDAGYMVDHFTVNGVDIVSTIPDQELTNIMVPIVEDTEVTVTFALPKTYCNNYEGSQKTRSDRYVGAVTLTCGSETLNVTGLQTSGASDIYFDRTDEVLEIKPDATVSFRPSQYAGQWMHGYVWVDWNRDYEFTPSFNGHAVADDSELVAFNYYDGYNSNGVATSNGANGYSSTYTFKVPADITPGDYRLRFIIDWDCIDPCGNPNFEKNPLTNNGGIILDLTLRYATATTAPEAGIEAVEATEEVAPVYYNLQGVRVANPANGVYIKVIGNKAEKVYLSK